MSDRTLAILILAVFIVLATVRLYYEVNREREAKFQSWTAGNRRMVWAALRAVGRLILRKSAKPEPKPAQKAEVPDA